MRPQKTDDVYMFLMHIYFFNEFLFDILMMVS